MDSPNKLRVFRLAGLLQASAALLALKVNFGLNSMPPIERVAALLLVIPPEWQASIMVMTLSALAEIFCVAWASSALVIAWPSWVSKPSTQPLTEGSQ